MIRKLTALVLALVLLVPVGTALAVKYYRVNTSWLKAHEDASYSSTVVDSYRRDFAVTIAKRYSGGWAKVRFRPGGAAVFVQEKYLEACSSYTAWISKDNTVLLSGPATSFDSKGRLNKGAQVTVLTKKVNFRKGPGKNYKVIAEYKPGTKVTLLQYGKEWCKVSVGGKTGYIMTKYLKRD